MRVKGVEYGVIGSTMGTHFIDISTNPSNTTEKSFIAGTYQGVGVIHRDYFSYKNYLYAVCDEGAGTSTLQIMDFSTLPDSVHLAYNSLQLFSGSHDIFIDTVAARMYVCISRKTNAFYALEIYDIQQPTQPVLLGSYNSWSGTPIGHVHDCYVKNNIAYLHCGYDGFHIVDFTNPTSPVLLGSLTVYPFSGYNHSGWMANDGIHYYMADEDHSYPMKVLDVSDPSDIKVVKNFDAGSTNPYSIPHNQMVKGDYLYVSYYYDGLQIYDIKNPADPIRVCEYDTYPSPHNPSYEGAWGVYPYLPSGKILVIDMQTGLYTLDIPTTIKVEDTHKTESGISVFSQPFEKSIHIQSQQMHEEVNVFLYNTVGQLVYDWKNTSIMAGRTTFAVPDGLPTGVYILQISQGNKALHHSKIIQSD
jgi:choice-of-anchor B domain-containing protein